MKSILLVGLLAFSTHAYAQGSIPAGTVLPVQLERSLSQKSVPGQVIKAKIMQDIPLANGSKIRAGAIVLGQVVAVTPATSGTNATISFRFDRLVVSRRTLPITTGLRALASMSEIDDAQLPDTGPDRGTPPTAYTTVQVGGDEVVYRGGGHVMDTSEEVVGEPVPPDGVLVRVRPNVSRGCRGQIDNNQQPQALWVFASDACGVYGYPNVKILNSGRDDPIGQIMLGVEQSKLNIRGGSGMLLRIIGNNMTGAQASRRS
jgi:hypothetical protein